MMQTRARYPEERVEKSLEIARVFAAKARRRYHGMADIEALEGAAYYGAAKALATYDEERGVKFSTWAICKVRSEILEEARQQDHIPRYFREQERAGKALPGWAERPASLDELGFWLDEEFLHPQFERAAAPWAEELPVPQADPTALEALTRCRDEAWRAWVALLPAQEREVLRLYYWRDMFCREVAEKLGISDTRVDQLLKAGLGRLREWLGAEAGG
jgi:RNA polymerase sigma factor FliA